MSAADARDVREQQIMYRAVRERLGSHYRPEDGRPGGSLFNWLGCLVEAWWQTWVRLVGETGLALERTLVFQDPRVLAGHVQRGIIVLGAILFLTGVLLRERR